MDGMNNFLTAVIFFGGFLMIATLGYLFNPYYDSHDESASWSSGVYSD